MTSTDRLLGAGIGGLALAMALHNKQVSFSLYEEAKEYSAVGAGIGFAPNGMRAMDLIEPGFRPLYDKICVGNKGAHVQNVFFEGLLLQEGLGRDQSWYGKSSWGHPEFNRKSAHRKALLDIMTSFIPVENVKFNKKLTKIDERPDGVVLTFSDGETTEASILAGADGIQSIVRQHVLQSHPDQIDPVYANSYCYRGVIPMSQAKEILGHLTDVAKFYFGYRKSAVTYRISGGDEFNFLHCVSTDEEWPVKNAVTEQVSHETMMQEFRGKDVDDRLRQLLSLAKPIRWGLFHHQYTSTYCRGRVVLIGDSAHASLPFQAAGAAQGVEDAVVLSAVIEEFAKACETDQSKIEAGLAAYDSIRRPRAQRQLEESAEVARMIFLEHEEAGSDMTKILPRLQNNRFDWLWFHDIEKDIQTALSNIRGDRS